MFLRRVITNFKSDFNEFQEQLVLSSPPNPRLGRPSSIQTTSDNASRYQESLTTAELPQPTDDSNNNEVVSPLQKRNLLQSLQQSSSFVSPSDSVPSIESTSELATEPIDFLTSSNASSSDPINSSPILSTTLANEIPEPLSKFESHNDNPIDSIPSFVSNSTSHRKYDALMESMQPPVTQAHQQSLTLSPYDDPAIRTTGINNNNHDDRRTSGTNKWTEHLPAYSKLMEEVVKLDENPATKTFPDTNLTSPKVNHRKVEQTKTLRGSKSQAFQSIGESSDLLSSNVLTPEDVLARGMEELGRIRRAESRNPLVQSKASPSQRPPQLNRTTATEQWQRLRALQEDSSSDTTTMLREAYIERQQELQTQLDKALAELRDVQAENKRLTTENRSQQHAISQLKIDLNKVKHAQDHSLVQIKNQLNEATSSLTVLNKEKMGWQERLDSMQHKLKVAERQVRCLDHLTRHRLEARHEAVFGQPKRRGLLMSVPASTDIIGAVNALNDEIYQSCVQLAECLERTSMHSNRHKPLSRKVLGNHLTAMMENQAGKTTSDYDMLLMQTVLEVFMVYWCSSIIEAFYPKQESFADMLIELSAQTARTSGSTICGKQIQIIQPSTPYLDDIKFTEWVKDIIKELGLVLAIGGLRVKTQRAPRFTTKVLALVKVAYDLRTAMAEKDICGDLEIVVVPSDTPFQVKWMMDAHPDARKGDMGHSHIDFVAGTSGIGLQRTLSERVDGQLKSRTETQLMPKVVLTRSLTHEKG